MFDKVNALNAWYAKECLECLEYLELIEFIKILWIAELLNEWKIKFAKNLEKRTLKFAIDITRFSATLGNSIENKVIRNQITKSGTSIGANYRESNRSRSRTDFKNKISICLSEASETLYWLELIKELKISSTDFNHLLNETNELISIFVSIIKKLREQKS